MPIGVYLRTEYHRIICGNNRRGKRHTEEWKKQASERLLGNTRTLGYKDSEETKRRKSEAQKGSKSHLWKDGITPENKKFRSGIEFRLWREAVFAIDNWTCQKCAIRGNQTGGYLHPHHIKNFAEHKGLRTSIENGITLCKKCHTDFHKKFGYKNNTREQLEEFLCFHLKKN